MAAVVRFGRALSPRAPQSTANFRLFPVLLPTCAEFRRNGTLRMGARRCFAPGPLRNREIAFGSGRFASTRPLGGAFRYGGGIPRGGARRTGGRLSGSSSAPRRVPPVGAVCARACAPSGSVGIPPVAIRRAFAAHPASRAVRGACLLLAVLRVLCAIGSAVLVRCGRETPAPTHRHIVRSAQSWRIMGSRRPGGSAMSDLSFPSAAKMAAVHKMPARSAVGRAAPARRLGGRASPRAAKPVDKLCLKQVEIRFLFISVHSVCSWVVDNFPLGWWARTSGLICAASTALPAIS